MGKAKYYAVRTGVTPGIYHSWEETEPLVKGYPGANFQGFKTLEGAQAFLEGRDIEEVSSTGALPTLEKDKNHSSFTPTEYVAYVDGSFDKKSNCYGSGVVLLRKNQVIDELSFYGNDSLYSDSYQIAGETSASLAAIQWAIDHDVSELTIAYDYQGIASWATGEWNARKAVSIDYVTRFNELSKHIQVHFMKVKGHSGVLHNERADELAALGFVTKKEKR